MTRGVLALLLAWCAGCATMFNEDSRLLVIHSEPAGARVTVDGHPAGVTPLRVPVSNHAGHVVHVAHPGYQPQICTFTTSGGAGWVVLDLLTTSFVGLVVDLVRGEWSSLDQTQCVVFFEPTPR